MLSRKMNNILKNSIYSIPITIRVTLWYTFFITILISIMITSSFFAANTFIKTESREELTEAVHKLSFKQKKFTNFDDGIFFIKYSNEGVIIDGLIPDNFDPTLPNIKRPEVKTYRHNGEEFLYFDAPLRIHHMHNKGEWIRGILPISKFYKNINILLIFISIFSPVLLFIIVYGGYKIVKNSFKPVNDISNTALEIQNSKDFSKRIKLGNGKDELHKMAFSFNKMLDSLESSYTHEKQFSSDVSHELRTPVTVILAESDYAINYAESLDEAKDSLSIIQRQTKKMSTLINQIMELAKLERQTCLETEDINLSNLITTSLKDYKYMLDDKNIQLFSDIEDNLIVSGNKIMLERVFDNLFSNALKFTNSKIYVNLYKKENITLEIIDDGIGLSNEDMKNIWHRFYQANSSRNKDNNQGYGLGLSMVQRIIDLHNANISVESELNKGSKFMIKF
ncbi:HAMP domain-containing sensor histidine kinase [Fusobacterium sp.]|uniref:sensor histidine kinase n=1 Tax=Fusobacterium sp. TaxID=68766 RepID=UPI0025B84C1C|nr:HAMP domain-containing sensor histidine kinase [Fusobacterium sp.]MCI5725087.1 HAMP domain-containing histidine kinase [Fusobacterium sp.]